MGLFVQSYSPGKCCIHCTGNNVPALTDQERHKRLEESLRLKDQWDDYYLDHQDELTMKDVGHLLKELSTRLKFLEGLDDEVVGK